MHTRSLTVLTSPSLYSAWHSFKTGFRYVSRSSKLTNDMVIRKRNDLFEAESKRQRALITRVEKIQVQYRGYPEDVTLIMNKNISTPYDCFKHLHESLRQRGILASVNGVPWDVHRPLEDDCQLEFLYFKQENPSIVNKALWRSCSFMLGYVIERGFKPEHYVQLHSWPAVSVESGSFVYDADIGIKSWKPRPDELDTLSRIAGKLILGDKIFERLEVDAGMALRIFDDNRFKCEQIPEIASGHEQSRVTLYRCGDHVDLSHGPMISRTRQVHSFAITASHPLETDVGVIYRFQGVALPMELTMSPFAYGLVKERAQKLNTVGLPVASTPPMDEVAHPDDTSSSSSDETSSSSSDDEDTPHKATQEVKLRRSRV